MAVRYLILQWQRCLKSILKTLGILFVILLISVAVIFGTMKILGAKNASLINVGLVIPEDEVTSLYVTELIASMDSVKSICQFHYIDSEAEAVEMYHAGQITAAVVIPQGFYHDVQVGLNPPAIIYIDSDGDIFSRVFKDILTAGVSYLQEAEAAVYASIDVSNEYEETTKADLGNNIALEYVNVIMRRNRIFESSMVSSFDSVSMGEYYVVSLILVVLLFSGITFNRMYFVADRATEEQLSIRGLRQPVCWALKVLVMAPILYVIGLLIYSLCLWISIRYGLFEIGFEKQIVGYMWIIAITMAIYFELIYEIVGDGKKGILVLVILNLIGIAISGMVIPSSYMANWVHTIGQYSLENWWMRLCFKVLG